jgi:hypothetical protein
MLKINACRIHLLWATIRPDAFVAQHKYWMKQATHPRCVSTYVAVNTNQQKYTLTEKGFKRVVATYPPNPGVCYPCYVLSSRLMGKDNDIVILGSDDFLAPRGWDDILREQLFEECAVLQVYDGAWNAAKIISIPIMTYSALLQLNKVIYHPDYFHCYSDDELYHNCRQLGLLKTIRDNHNIMFEHKHWHLRKRAKDEHDKAIKSLMGRDIKVYRERAKWPVEKRLEVGTKPNYRLV